MTFISLDFFCQFLSQKNISLYLGKNNIDIFVYLYTLIQSCTSGYLDKCTGTLKKIPYNISKAHNKAQIQHPSKDEDNARYAVKSKISSKTKLR